MEEIEQKKALSALEINLQRTRTDVEIPERYSDLLAVAASYSQVGRRTEEMLRELHHPYVNHGYLLQQLRALSIGEFNYFNSHAGALPALQSFADVYFDIITSPVAGEEIKDGAVRHCMEFLDTVLAKSGKYLERNLPLISDIMTRLTRFAGEQNHLFKRSSGYAGDIARMVMENRMAESFKRDAAAILYLSLKATYSFWLDQPDPAHWQPRDAGDGQSAAFWGDLAAPLSHEHTAALLVSLEETQQKKKPMDEKITAFLAFPDYARIANGYMAVADEIERSAAFSGRSYLVKLEFLFNMMGVDGLAGQRNAIFTEINRCLSMALQEENEDELYDFIRNIFRLLRKPAVHDSYRNAVLDCILTLAREVFRLNNHALVDAFINEIIAFGFQHPDVKGATADWQVQVNPAHIKNIRAWLEIIAMKPRWAKKLLSALIINLKLGGVFVSDADLLQKDISNLLNADILPAYNKIKQLLRIFPIYFQEIGAEGELRTLSTEVDELSSRHDKLVYFVRKQSHVESNSLLVPFIEDIFRYWQTGDKTALKARLPEEVYREISPSGEYFSDLQIIFTELFSKIHGDPSSLLVWDAARIEKEISPIADVCDREKKRAVLMIRLYQALHRKYFHQNTDIIAELDKSGFFSREKVHAFRRSIERRDCYRSLNLVLEMLTILKNRILSPQKTRYMEEIYYKRHLAAGIPSMYGTYREEKFEAMGLTFRLESAAQVLFERLLESINLRFITKSTLVKIHKYLWLYMKALDLEGIATEGLIGKLKLFTSALQIRQFTIDQYFDILHFISRGIQDIIRDYYIDVHSDNFPVIFAQIAGEKDAGESSDRERLYQSSENFSRSIISSAFGIQPLDRFVNKIIDALSADMEKFKNDRNILNQVMAYTPELAISSLYLKNKRVDNQIMIGNKAYMLKELISLDLPVPPGFVITTEVFRGYEGVLGHKSIYKDLKLRVYREIKELERVTGKVFGNPDNPLLLSVRSGATISLPGMMRSFLNVGINETIAEGLSRKNKHQWAAWDSYRRFLQTWGMFQGLERNIFDEIIARFKERYLVTKKFLFDKEQMKRVALAYRAAIMERGIRIPENPYGQLHHAVLEVFASWNSEQARIYRHQARLSDEWGTAVMVQAMVFGNLNENSGSGVIFTRDPKGSSQDVAINGDFIFCVQGDDIVSGLVETYPVSEKQRISEKREASLSLESKFPEIYRELVRIAEMLIYDKGFNHQEIEFTFENATKSGLFILQTRDMVQRENRHTRMFIGGADLEESFVGAGIGVSGGALTGRAVYTEEEIQRFRESEKQTALILLRPDTVPDDVGIILQADGILTARGGGTSHAAVTIPQLKKVGVVGLSKLRVFEADGYSEINGRTIRGGDFISIDGWTGAVYLGKHEIREC